MSVGVRGQAGQGGREASRVRIIGGEWRGRKLSFPAVAGLRPTPDRVRETLYNWLRPTLAGSRCLDAYAGTGALGLEALSQGAASCLFVERDPAIATALERNLELLGAAGARLLRQDAAHALLRVEGPFDLILLDPPFGSGLLERSVGTVCDRGLLSPSGRLYVEMDAGDDPERLHPELELLRSGRAGRVGFHLLAPGS